MKLNNLNLDIRKLFTGVPLTIILILLWTSFTVISPSERAVRVTLGDPSPKVLTGLQFKLPFIQQFRKYDLQPTTEDMVVDIKQGGAVSSDNQIIGASSKIVWTYDATRIMDIVNKYPDTDRLTQIVNNTVYEALKAEIGKYTIFELARNAQKIANDTRSAAVTKLAPYPIILTQFNLTNWDWSEEFDKRINDTIAAQQQVAQAKAVADREEQVQRAQAIKAEATAKANVAIAQGDKQSAELRRDAKIAEGDGISKYNAAIAQNRDLELEFRRLEIEKLRVERWNGASVSTYLPLNAAGSIVQLPTTEKK